MKHLLLITIFISNSVFSSEITPNDVQKRIYEVGHRQVIKESIYTPIWQAILNGIETGNADWLKVYILLKSGSDAGSSEDLSWAILNAFPKSPYEVIDILHRENNGSYSIKEVCTFTFEYDTPSIGIKKFLLQLETSLMKNKNTSKIDIYNNCIKGIEQTRKDFKIQ